MLSLSSSSLSESSWAYNSIQDSISCSSTHRLVHSAINYLCIQSSQLTWIEPYSIAWAYPPSPRKGALQLWWLLGQRGCHYHATKLRISLSLLGPTPPFKRCTIDIDGVSIEKTSEIILDLRRLRFDLISANRTPTCLILSSAMVFSTAEVAETLSESMML